MSLTPRKVASLLGAAALGVTAMTGAGWAAGSTARASVARPSFSKLSPSQVKARSSGKRERMVVVFDDQLTNLPANRAHRQRPRSNGRVHAGSARSPAEAGRGHAYHDPFAPQRCRGDNAGGRGTGTQPHPGRQGGRPRRNHHHRGRHVEHATTVAASRVRKSTIPATAADGQQLCNTSPSKPLLEPEALTSIHDASDNPNDPNEASTIATGQGVIIGNVDADTLAGNPNMIRPNGQHVIIDAPNPNENVFSDEFNGDVSTIGRPGHGHLHLRVSAALLEHPRELQLPNRG